jgi:hypothetical protein
VNHGADAVAYVQIRLSLRAVAEHIQVPGMIEQLPAEIEHVAVGIARSENGDEPEDPRLHSKSFAVSLNHAFARQFRGAVKGSLDGKRMTFRRRYHAGLAVYRTGGGKPEPPDVVGAHGFENVKRGARVLFEVPGGMLQAEPHVRIGSEMIDEPATFHGGGESGKVEVVPLDQAEPFAGESVREELAPAGAEVVPADYMMAALEQQVNQVTSDETGRAGDKDV